VTLNPGSEQKQNCRATKLNIIIIIRAYYYLWTWTDH